MITARRLPVLLGLAVTTLGGAVLLGWVRDVEVLKTVFPGLVTMKVNTALGLALCGTALALLARPQAGKGARAAVAGLAAVVTALGALTLMQYLGGWDLHLDQKLFPDSSLNKVSTSSPGRMAPISALSFVFLGVAFLLSIRPTPARWRHPVIGALAAAVGGIGVVAFFGCLLKLATGSLWWDYTGLAVHTAAGFIMLGTGMLAWSGRESGLAWSLDARVSGGFLLAVALMVTIAGASFGFTSKLRESDQWVSHTQEVLKEIQDVATDVTRLQSEQRGYFISGDAKLLERYAQAREAVRKNLAEVHQLTADNRWQQERVDQLRPLIDRRIAWSDENIAIFQQNGFAAVQQRLLTGTGIALSDEIMGLIKSMEDEEHRLLREREIQAGPLATTAFLLLPLGVFFSLALLFLGMALLNADAGARERAEQAMAQLAAIVDSSFDAIVGKDLQSIVTSWNAGAERMFGYTASEMIGSSITRLIPPDHLGEEERILSRVRRGESVEHFETVRVRKDGALIHVSVAVSPIKDASGRIVGASKVARDITERRQAEAALRESEARLLKMFLSCPVGVAIHRWSDRTFVDINAAFTELTGWAREEVIGRTTDQMTIVEAGAATAALRTRLAAHATVRNAEMTIKTRHGEPRYVLLSTDLVELRGEPHAITTFVDITDRKRAEERAVWLATFPERNPNPILEVDLADGVFHYLNSAALRQFPDLEKQGLRHPLVGGLREREAEIAEQGTLRREIAVGGCFLSQVVTYVAEARRVRVYSTDITERQRAEQIIRQERDFSAAVLNSMPGVLYLYDANGKFLRWNTNFELVTGYTGAEIAGMSPLDFFAEADRPLLTARIGEVFAQGQSDAEADFVAKDGRRTPYYFTGVRTELNGAPCLVGVGLDLTERRQAEEARRASEGRYRTLFEYAPDGIVIADQQSYYLDANTSLCRMLGYTRDEFIGLHASDIVAPVEVPHIGSALRVLNANSDHQREWQFRRKDGSVFPAEVIATQMPDGNLLAMIRDITERRAAELALREKEAQLHATDRRLAEIVQGMTEACFALDREWRFTFVNDRTETLLRHRREEMLGRSIWEIFQKLVGTPMETNYRRAMAERVPVAFEALSPIAGRWLDIRLFPTGEGLAAFLLDIDTRKEAEAVIRESEQRLRGILDTMFVFVGLMNLDGQIVEVNLAPLEAAGLTREEVLGRTVAESFWFSHSPAVQEQVREALARAAQGEVMRDDYLIRVAGGQHITIDTTFAPLRDAAGRVAQIVGSAVDITERKRAEEQIHQLNAELEQRVIERTMQLEAANQELEAFSYSVSHDLRAPLRAVDGFSQAVLEDYGPQLPAEGQRYLETIRGGAQRMGNLIDDLLTFARLSRAPLSQHRVEPARLVRDIWEDLAPQREGRHVEFACGGLPACAGDAALLRQVWVNLLSNALKYSRPRDPAVIEIGSTAEAGETVYFVRDNGTGFDMRYAGKLFGVFQRLHRAEDFEGTGVGLAIVQRVIHRHGGRVWAKAEVDRGATFFFTLPRGTPQ
jgi:PAS domain S-box-containing protein